MLTGWGSIFKHWDNILSTCCDAECGGRKPINSYMIMLLVIRGAVYVCSHHTMTCFVSDFLPRIHPLMNPQIKEEKTPVVTAVPPQPLSAVPGGFLKQLVRDSEKETKQKEPEVKEEKQVSRIRLVSIFLSNSPLQTLLIRSSCSQTSWTTTLCSSSSSQIRLLRSSRPRCPYVLSSWLTTASTYSPLTTKTKRKPDREHRHSHQSSNKTRGRRRAGGRPRLSKKRRG